MASRITAAEAIAKIDDQIMTEAVAAERERCAKIAEEHAKALRNGGAINACKHIAAAIRGQD